MSEISFPTNRNADKKFEIEKDGVYLRHFMQAVQSKMINSVMEKNRFGWEQYDYDILLKLFYEHIEKFKERSEHGINDVLDIGAISMMMYSKLNGYDHASVVFRHMYPSETCLSASCKYVMGDIGKKKNYCAAIGQPCFSQPCNDYEPINWIVERKNHV